MFKRASLPDTDSLLTNHCAPHPIVDKQGQKKGTSKSFMGHRNGLWNEELSGCTGIQSRVVTGEKTETEQSEPPNSRDRDVLETNGVTDSIKAAAVYEGCVKAGGCNFKEIKMSLWTRQAQA